MLAGNPNIPLQITELMTSAVRLQRPMARTRLTGVPASMTLVTASAGSRSRSNEFSS